MRKCTNITRETHGGAIFEMFTPTTPYIGGCQLFSLCSCLRDNYVLCFSDVTQPVGNIFMQNDSRPCPSLHGHHSTSRTMSQGKIAAETPKDAFLSRVITSFETKGTRASARMIILLNYSECDDGFDPR